MQKGGDGGRKEVECLDLWNFDEFKTKIYRNYVTKQCDACINFEVALSDLYQILMKVLLLFEHCEF